MDNLEIISNSDIIDLFDNKFNNSKTYFDILLYNCYDKENKTINLNKLDKIIDDITDVYQSLFNICITMSAFQFTGLFLQDITSSIGPNLEFSYFMLSIGFMFSMFGVLLTFLVIEYMKGFRHESKEFIIIGLNKYKHIFKLADHIIYINSVCFLIPINIIIYKNTNYYMSIIFNIISIILFIFGIYFHHKIIVQKQKYILYQGNNFFVKFIDNYLLIDVFSKNDSRKYTRKIYL